MQKDMHYYGTYILARTAGLKREAARIIATSSQFVDDNAQEASISFKDASRCCIEPTAHHTADFENISPDAQRYVWVPFHFLPGNQGEEFTERLVCQKDSLIAQQMRDNHASQTDKPYFLELVGIMTHVYEDTFAHYGFSGVSSRKNRVKSNSFKFMDIDENIHKYLIEKSESFIKKFGYQLLRNIKSQLAMDFSGALGHSGVVTLPDRPFLKWCFDYESGHNSGWRDNKKTYIESCQKLHNIFTKIAEQAPQYRDSSQHQNWADIEIKIADILTVQGPQKERIKAWQNATEQGDLLKIKETIPEYRDWNEGFTALSDKQDCQQIMTHPIYRFYQAASYHRWYILRELLPAHGLMVI